MHLSQSLLITFLVINSMFAINEIPDSCQPSIEHASAVVFQPGARSQQPSTESPCWRCNQREDTPGSYNDLCADHKEAQIRRLTIAANCFLLCMLAYYFIGVRH